MTCNRLYLLSIAFLLAGNTTALAADMQKVGVIGSIQGTVTAVMPDKTTPTLKAGEAIYLDEKIHSEKNASAQLMFLDRSTLTIVPDTDITIDTFVYNPADSTGKMSLEATKGTLRFIGGMLSKEDYVTIKTPVSTVGIRGGIVQVSVADNGSKANAIFFYGHDMTVHNASGAGQIVTQFGNGVSMRNNGSTEPMKAEEVNATVHKFNSATVQPAAPASPAGTPPPKTGDTTNNGATNGNTANGTTSANDTASGNATDNNTGSSTASGNSTSDNTSGSSSTTSSGTGSSTTSAGASTGSNSGTYSGSSAGTVPPYDNPNNWGPWAQTVFTQSQGGGNLSTITSAVTGLQPLTLANAPTSFGVVNYAGPVYGSTTINGINANQAGTFTSQINFNTRALTSLSFNFGNFTFGTNGSTTNLNNINLSGQILIPTTNQLPGWGAAVTGTANSSLYGANADLYSGKFNVGTGAGVNTGSASGAFVGGKQP